MSSRGPPPGPAEGHPDPTSAHTHTHTNTHLKTLWKGGTSRSPWHGAGWVSADWNERSERTEPHGAAEPTGRQSPTQPGSPARQRTSQEPAGDQPQPATRLQLRLHLRKRSHSTVKLHRTSPSVTGEGHAETFSPSRAARRASVTNKGTNIPDTPRQTAAPRGDTRAEERGG